MRTRARVFGDANQPFIVMMRVYMCTYVYMHVGHVSSAKIQIAHAHTRPVRTRTYLDDIPLLSATDDVRIE